MFLLFEQRSDGAFGGGRRMGLHDLGLVLSVRRGLLLLVGLHVGRQLLTLMISLDFILHIASFGS